jgi:outer membrane protein assembly factor BamB
MNLFSRTALAILTCGAAAYCANWVTFGGGPQRDGWSREESELSRENVGKLKLLWSAKLENAPRELTSLTQPVVLGTQYTPKGAMDVVIVAGSADSLFALDSDTGKVVWSRQFRTEQKPKQAAEWLCPNALNATPVIDPATKMVYAIAADGTLHVVHAISGEEMRTPVQIVPSFAKTWSLNLVNGVLYTSVSQGCNGVKSGVVTLNVKEKETTPHFFVTAPAGAGVWGRGGVSVDPDTGIAYAATGDAPVDPAKGKYGDTVLSVDASGKLLDYFTPSNWEWITRKDLDMGNITPVLFPFGGKKLLVTGGKEGVLYMLDAASLGGADHHTPLFKSPRICNDDQTFQGQGIWGGLASAADGDTTWLYAPVWGPPAAAVKFPVTHGEAKEGSIMAFRVTSDGGKPVLTPAWVSPNLSVPEPPVYANGLVFALSTGENVTQVDANGLLTSAQRSVTKNHAVLYALDAKTGEQLYSSGDAMKDWAHFSGITVVNGHVYAVTHNSTVYAFGFPE